MTRAPLGRHAHLARSSTVVLPGLALGLALALTACGSDDSTADPEQAAPSSATDSSSASPSETAGDSASESAGQSIDITVENGTVTPNGDRVEVRAGEPIDLVVTADAPGEIHVHATPEQELTYDAGTTTLPLTIDKPGLVDVESHTLDVTIVQLEVR